MNILIVLLQGIGGWLVTLIINGKKVRQEGPYPLELATAISREKKARLLNK